MKKLGLLLVTAFAYHTPTQPITADRARWQAHADNVTITRDDWGIPHVRGKSDADAVFGAMYAWAEDDFNRVETNLITSLGRTAEAEGESAIYRDLRMKLFIDPDSMKKIYASGPAFLKQLMVAWADGLNFYLAKHPEMKPRVIKAFEPWMALSFSEGSIGNDIDQVNVSQLQAFYGSGPVKLSSMTTGSDFDRAARVAYAARAVNDAVEKEPSGSNGMAVSPRGTKAGRALLLINPHTSFFFREELQMTSDEGLDAYGAATWGQFFIHQGFNRTAGWMHTTSAADRTDECIETVAQSGDQCTYKLRRQRAQHGGAVPVGQLWDRWLRLGHGRIQIPRKWYGTSGNSFVAVVDFGKDSVRARAVTAGDLNSVIGSKHFNDQGARYSAGDLRDVYFYPNQLKAHTERVCKPGN